MGRRGENTHLYAAVLATAFAVEDAAFAFRRIAVHDGDDQMALEVL